MLSDALLVLFLVVSVLGGNRVFAMNRRRRGKQAGPMFSEFPLLHFNRREWLLLGAVIVVSLAIAIVAVKVR